MCVTTRTPIRWTPIVQFMTYLHCSSVTVLIILKVSTKQSFCFILHASDRFLKCNKHIFHSFAKHCFPAGAGGKFWYVSNSGLVCSDGDTPEEFYFEFLEHGRIAIRAKNGKYLRGDQGGILKGDGDVADSSSLWEY